MFSDGLVWVAMEDDCFSTKTIYSFILQCFVADAPSTSMAGCKVETWKALWKAKSIHICHGVLPTREALARRGLEVDPICPLCGEEAESSAYALLLCSIIASLWFKSSLSFSLHVAPISFSLVVAKFFQS